MDGAGVDPSRHSPLERVLARPALLVASGVVLAAVAFQLWVTPSNPPGFIRDEASISYNAYTISQDLRDQDGGRLPLYITSFGDYKSPLFVYLLAGVFRLTGPSPEVARFLAATSVLFAVLLLGLLAYRRTKSIAVAAVTVGFAGLTPWLFELGRVAYETCLQPLVLVGLLVALDWADRSTRHFALRALPVGLMLGATTYVYAGGRLLGPLLAVALAVFAGRGRWPWLLTTWSIFALTLVPLAAYARNHPGALTARYQATTFIQDGMSFWSVVREAAGHYAHDVNLWHWVVSGDPKPYIHTWGAGSLFAATVVLAALGAVTVMRERSGDRWWRYVLVSLLLAPVPAALTEDRFYSLRLVPLAVILLVLAIPGLQWLLVHARTSWPARAVVAALAVVSLVQFAHFLDVYREKGPGRTELFEAGVPVLLERAFGAGGSVHIDLDDRYAQTHALWYAVSRGLPRERIVVLPDGGITPDGQMVFGRLQPCDYVCTELGRAHDYWIARSEGPKPT